MTEVASSRAGLIARYEAGPAKLKAALETVPADAMQWRPAEGAWSAHEIIVHCADSESNAALRIRYLIAEPAPLIVGYDQEVWARVFDYHSHPLEPALLAIEAARANTAPLIRRLPEEAWRKVGRHTESGTYSAERWLEIYAAHLEEHTQQIEANVAAWRARPG